MFETDGTASAKAQGWKDTCWVYLRNNKEVTAAGAEGVRGRQTGDDSLDVGRKQTGDVAF